MDTIIGVYFIIVSIFVTIFQVLLIFKAPLGSYTLGGKIEGVLPKKLRVAAFFQIIILWFFVYIVTSHAQVITSGFYQDWMIWIVVVFFFFGSIANVSSESKKERNLFGPINVITFILLLILAL